MCYDCYGYDKETDFRRGKVEVNDFYEEVNYKPKKKDKKSRKKYPGCPGNEGKAHVYVWTSEGQREDLFSRFFGFHKYQRRICVGCGKKNGTKYSDQYEARKKREWDKRFVISIERGEPVPRGYRNRKYTPSYKYWSWENHHDEYMKYRKDYIKLHGWNNYVYGSHWL